MNHRRKPVVSFYTGTGALSCGCCCSLAEAAIRTSTDHHPGIARVVIPTLQPYLS